MLELIFVKAETKKVVYAINQVSLIRYVTKSEVGFEKHGRPRSVPFPADEILEIRHTSS